MRVNAFALLLVVPTAILGSIAIHALRRRSTPGALVLGAMSLSFALGVVAYALELMTPDLEGKLMWVGVRYVTSNVAVPLMLCMALWVTGNTAWLAPRRMALLFALPGLSLLLYFTNDLHRLHYVSTWLDLSGPIPMLGKKEGPLYLGFMLLYHFYAFWGLSVLMRAMIRREHYLLGKQATYMFAAFATPLVTNWFYIAGLRPFGILNPTPFGLAIFGAAMAWAVFKWRLLRLRPVARDQLFTELRDGMVVLDRENVVTDLNPSAERRFGAVSGAIGRPADEVLASWPQLVEFCRGDAKGHGEVPSGDRCYDCDLTPICGETGEPVGKMVLFRDVTERKQVERERFEMERSLLQARKVESLAAMAAGIAHDFNNLLHIVFGNLDLARIDIPPNSRAGLSIESAMRGAARAAELTHQMLTYLGQGRFVPAEADLSSLVRDSLVVLRKSVPEPIRIENGSPPGPLMVRADPIQVRQLLKNLILNASEAIGEGTGAITVRTAVEECGAETFLLSRTRERPVPGTYVRIDVADTGSGMDEVALSRLFDPFFTTRFVGRGLGMSTVLGIVQAHRGGILVESEAGGGTLVRVYLPSAENGGASRGSLSGTTAGPLASKPVNGSGGGRSSFD